MNIEAQISQSVLTAVKELYGQDVDASMVALQKTKSTFEGSLTLVVFPLLRVSKKKPEDTAGDIGAYLKEHCPAVADFNVVKGFLNLVIAPEAWVNLLNDIHADEQWGYVHAGTADNRPLVMIEYSSPNTNKPLHLGHVRNQRQPCGEDEYRQRPRYPHLQVDACVAEVGQRRDSREQWQER